MSRRRIPLSDAVGAIESVLARRRSEPPEIRPETSLEDLALESIEVVEVFIEIEARTGCVVSDSDVDRLGRVRDIAAMPCL